MSKRAPENIAQQGFWEEEPQAEGSKPRPENIAQQGFWEEEPQAEGSKPRGKRAAGETGFAATRRSLRPAESELPQRTGK